MSEVPEEMSAPESGQSLTKEQEMARLHFTNNRQLSRDYMNAYMWLLFCYRDSGASINFAGIKPLLTYEEFFSKYAQDTQDYVMRLSNQEKVKDVNRLVTSFNADLDRIKAKRDAGAVSSFLGEIRSLLEGEDYQK